MNLLLRFFATFWPNKVSRRGMTPRHVSDVIYRFHENGVRQPGADGSVWEQKPRRRDPPNVVQHRDRKPGA